MYSKKLLICLILIVMILPVLLGLYAKSNEIPQTWINKVIENIKQKENTSILQYKDNRPAIKAVNVISEPPDWMGESNQASSEYACWAASTAGDVNNDGYDDIIVGAESYDNGEVNEGAAFVYYGSSTGPSLAADWMGESNQESAYYGISASGAGDVNNDGFDDVIVGAYLYGGNFEGAAFVYYGSSSGLSTTPDWTVLGSQPFTIFGISVSGAGDVNNDGYDDVIVGTMYTDTVYLYYGSLTGLSLNPDWKTVAPTGGGYFGWPVSTAGDVNNDGYDDVIIGDLYYDNGQEDEGAAFVYYGSSSGLSTIADWTMEGNQDSAWFGYPGGCGTAGDVNGDGYDDVIIGAPGYDNGQIEEGRAYVYYGSSGGLSLIANWTMEINHDSAGFGTGCTAGDVNNDGYDDVIIGACQWTNGELCEGAAYLYLGSSTGLSGTAQWTVESNQDSSMFGLQCSAAGDVNGDGYNDVIIGAYMYDNGELDEGAAFMYYGNSSGVLIEELSIAGYAGDGYIQLTWHKTSSEYTYKIYKKRNRSYQLLCETMETQYIDKDALTGQNEYKVVMYRADKKICEHAIDVLYINNEITQIKGKIYFEMNYLNNLISIGEIRIYSIAGQKINEIKATGEYILEDKNKKRQKIIVIK